jgi:post-segregation antitoxin (ccd killing protein)
MILYVNGCSHSAAAEAAVSHAWACDDGELWRHGKEPHPANLAVSYGRHIADALNAKLICQASSGGSNDRIIRTTTNWIENNRDRLADTFMILQWTTWEREEWFHEGTWYQVNASGIDTVPDELQQRYKNYVINVDWAVKTPQAHDKIWKMHVYLKELGIRHLFFSGHSTFSDIQNHQDWGVNYMHPYVREESYHNWLKNNGGTYANAASYHFDAKSHRLWAQHVLQYINDNNLIALNEISAD